MWIEIVGSMLLKHVLTHASWPSSSWFMLFRLCEGLILCIGLAIRIHARKFGNQCLKFWLCFISAVSPSIYERKIHAETHHFAMLNAVKRQVFRIGSVRYAEGLW